jgi:hypothetical protein
MTIKRELEWTVPMRRVAQTNWSCGKKCGAPQPNVSAKDPVAARVRRFV